MNNVVKVARITRLIGYFILTLVLLRIPLYITSYYINFIKTDTGFRPYPFSQTLPVILSWIRQIILSGLIGYSFIGGGQMLLLIFQKLGRISSVSVRK